MAVGRSRALGRRKRWGIGFVGAILVGIVPTASAAADGCGGPVRVETLHVHVTAARAVVRAGSAAALEVTVAREIGHHDLAPVEDADVLVLADVGRRTIGADGTTGVAGLAAISLDVPRSSIGPADVTVVATRHPHECVEEYGDTFKKALFTIRK